MPAENKSETAKEYDPEAEVEAQLLALEKADKNFEHIPFGEDPDDIKWEVELRIHPCLVKQHTVSETKASSQRLHRQAFQLKKPLKELEDKKVAYKQILARVQVELAERRKAAGLPLHDE